MSIKIGINGLGRIGRAVLRILMKRPDLELVAVNDINPDIENMAYLIRYDSTYGRLDKTVQSEKDHISIGGEKRFRVFHQERMEEVPWGDLGVQVVVDASGVKRNLLNARQLKKQNVKHCVVTNAPADHEIDATFIMGVNQETFHPEKHFLVSSSICDSNAFVPVAHLLDKHFGIKHGFLTTLHPWLNYQNLLDGPSISYATPGKIHDHYALGRASVGSLIPKTTSAISASCRVLRQLEGKFLSMSYRVPTTIVSSADLAVELEKKTDLESIKQVFEEAERNQRWKVIYNNKEALVSTDFAGFEYSSVIDHRWMQLNDHNYLKMVLWYDNEWAYSSRVVDLIEFVGNQKGKEG